MREILFRAKRINDGEWVEGYYAIARDRRGLEQHNILITDNKHGYFEWHEIDPETICQFTGLSDKHGNKIWENDIVEIPKEDDYFRIEWQEDTASFVMTNDSFVVTFDNYWSYEVEVVDSIFDNPELLKGGIV